MDNSIMLFGESFEGNYSIKASKTNDIIFQGKNRIPVMELKANGDIYVKGKLVENDKEVVEGLRMFLGGLSKWELIQE